MAGKAVDRYARRLSVTHCDDATARLAKTGK